MTLDTVNVLEIANLSLCQINQLRSYPDTPEGNKEAEATFREWVRDANPGRIEPITEEEMEDALDNGIFEVGDGAIIITHST